jgi:hypothetical protein
MAIIEDNFSLGNINNGFDNDIARAIEEYLSRIARAVNTKPDIVRFTRSPTTSDNKYKFGTLWIDTNASPNTVYQLTEITGTISATWIQLG